MVTAVSVKYENSMEIWPELESAHSSLGRYVLSAFNLYLQYAAHIPQFVTLCVYSLS